MLGRFFPSPVAAKVPEICRLIANSLDAPVVLAPYFADTETMLKLLDAWPNVTGFEIHNEALRYHGPHIDNTPLTEDSDHALCVAELDDAG